MPRAFERLEVEPVRRTAVRLVERMTARLPDRNLVRVGDEVVRLIDDVASGSSEIRGRLRAARVASRVLLAVVVVLAGVVFALALRDARDEQALANSFDWLPLIEAGINDLVFIAIAVFFLHSVPDRLERAHTLSLLHRLRSLAHIVDMHQLTKDPERLRGSYVPSSRSADVALDRGQMEAYLDYCSELLSLIAKAAALCAEESQDSVVLDTVSTIETLTTDMARKIWQKIALLPRG